MQPDLGTRRLRLLQQDGLHFKDHNGNGRLDPYEDWRLPPAERARDLVARMTLEEKAGAMMHANPPASAPSSPSASVPGAGTHWSMPGLRSLLLERHITAYLNRLASDVVSLAEQANGLQALAEEGRLGIPVTLSSDPRNQFGASQGVSVGAGAFTKWPDPTGLAATGDAAVVRGHADSVRQEYLAVGIRMALSPMADLSVNPRWHRSNGTFGSCPEQVRRFVKAYVEGMQRGGEGAGAEGVACVVKHWVGYGATQADGFDAHSHYGRELSLSTATIEQHLEPFLGAFEARVGGLMPSYGLPGEDLHVEGASGPIERVGIGFNRQMLTELLRGRFGYGGLIVSDWHITDDCTPACRDGAPTGQPPSPADIGMPWGVEHLSKAERFVKAVRAGVEQFGGAHEPGFIVEAVRAGRLDAALVDRAVQRILELKFRQGLFENPYVHAESAARMVGNASFKALALEAQHRSAVLIKHDRRTLPLRSVGTKVWLHGLDATVARRRGFTVVAQPEDADVVLMSVSTPSELLHPGHFFGARYREGDTGFKEGNPDYEIFKRASALRPTVVAVYLDRPADLVRIAAPASAIVGHFGLCAEALFDLLTGAQAFRGRLPHDLPWSGTAQSADGLALRLGEGLASEQR